MDSPLHRIAALAALSLLSLACKGPVPDYTTEGWSFKGGGYFYGSEIEDEVGDSLDGAGGGGRIEIAKAFDETHRNLELGARLSVGARGLTDDGRTVPGVTLNMDSADIFIDALVRGYIPTDGKLRPYGEAFLGYGAVFADFSSPDIPGIVLEEDFSGLTVGVGGGVEINPTDRFLIQVGVEYRLSDLSSTDFGDATLRDFGGVIMLGTRW